MKQDNNKQRIQREVDATLKAFDSSSALPHDPWFFDKLSRRMKSERQSATDLQPGWYRRALKPALLATLVALNIFALVWIM